MVRLSLPLLRRLEDSYWPEILGVVLGSILAIYLLARWG